MTDIGNSFSVSIITEDQFLEVQVSDECRERFISGSFDRRFLCCRFFETTAKNNIEDITSVGQQCLIDRNSLVFHNERKITELLKRLKTISFRDFLSLQVGLS